MKRLTAMVLVCLLCAASALAAEWPEGLGPDQPLPGVRKLDLTKEMGYCYTYPKPGLEVSHFCNVLEIYLPREDIELGAGHAHLYDSTDTEVADIDFANPEQVLLRTQEEAELAAKKWGGGVCIEMNLPVSLKFGESYYVLMDLNCFTAGENRISNYDLMMELITYCVDHSIDDVLKLPDVKERVDLYFEQQELFKAQLDRIAKIEGKVVVIDLRNEETIYAGNRFMI